MITYWLGLVDAREVIYLFYRELIVIYVLRFEA